MSILAISEYANSRIPDVRYRHKELERRLLILFSDSSFNVALYFSLSLFLMTRLVP